MTVQKSLIAIFLILALLIVLAANLKSATITISPYVTLTPVTYPDNVAEMSQDEFYTWATNRNKKVSTEWETKYKAAGDKYIYGSYRASTVNSKSSSTSSSTMMAYGVNSGPGRQYFTSKTQDKLIPTRRLNPHFRHPGPLTLVNPYVRPR